MANTSIATHQLQACPGSAGQGRAGLGLAAAAVGAAAAAWHRSITNLLRFPIKSKTSSKRQQTATTSRSHRAAVQGSCQNIFYKRENKESIKEKTCQDAAWPAGDKAAEEQRSASRGCRFFIHFTCKVSKLTRTTQSQRTVGKRRRECEGAGGGGNTGEATL